MKLSSKIVLVADDDPVVVRTACKALARRYEIAPAVTMLSRLDAALERYQPDGLLMRIMWRGECVLPRLSHLLRRCPALRVCMYSAYDALPFVGDAFAAGARGYLVKPGTISDLYRAIADVLAGRLYLSAYLAARPDVVEAVSARQRPTWAIVVPEVGTEVFAQHASWLVYARAVTPMEARIMLLASGGLGVKEIAARLRRSADTVASHCRDIYAKLRPSGVRDRASLARLVAETLIKMPPEWKPPEHWVRMA